MLIRKNLLNTFSFFVLFTACSIAFSNPPSITGQLKQWHKITLTFDGPSASETGTPNPFTDYRLNITFSIGSRSYTVPGYFAADGNAAETGATAGDKWRVHFSPDSVGTWNYTVSFRTGSYVAVDPDPLAGSAVPGTIDGFTGNFTVGPTDKSGNDLRGKGRLRYAGGHYLQFAGNGEYFIKAGTDAPENLLGYYEFDNTQCYGGSNTRKTKGTKTYVANGITYQYHADTLHHYDPHLDDWNTGDPVWHGDKGKRIIGVLNYLAEKGLNVISFLTLNTGGDGQDVHPYVNYNNDASPQDDRLRFDISKLDQWEIVFNHADSLGLLLHVKLQETENDQLLDGGHLGAERILYYGMMIAHFGHHLALEWNMGEENDLWTELNDPANTYLQSYAQFFNNYDPYHHPIVAHTYPGQQSQVYTPLLGFTGFTGASLQTDIPSNVHQQTLDWIAESANSGHEWVTTSDEIGPASWGVKPDGEGHNHEEVRKEVIWGNLMAGGGGIQHYFGYNTLHHDLDCEWFGSREKTWDYSRIARELMETLPVQEMTNMNSLVGNAGNNNNKYCLAKPGEVYLIFLANGGTTDLNLSATSNLFDVRWYDPRNGGNLQTGSVAAVSGGASGISVGNAPDSTTRDWVVVVSAQGSNFPVEFLDFTATPIQSNVLLQWSTAREENSAWFSVMRSVDGVLWENVGGLPAAGNSHTVKNYSLTDHNLAKGVYYYQIKETDLDGKFQLTDIVEVTISDVRAIVSVFPNPAHDHLTIQVEMNQDNAVNYYLVNALGQKAVEQTENISRGIWNKTLDLSGYSSGLYYLFVRIGEDNYVRPVQIQ
ncbi:MAG: DUF5060 domain-containing protein [Bacteroidia bacterium]|nr:DUF5060 domain-containing protein [Bacteroidia bacterium]